MNYEKIYNDLIQKRRDHVLNKTDQYCECHHILPRSCNGSDDKSNLINFTAKEHFIAHLLLIKIYQQQKNVKFYKAMVSALVFMADKNRKFHPEVRINSRLYEKYNKIRSKQLSKTVGKHTKNKSLAYNPITKEQIFIKNDQQLPDGFQYGMLSHSISDNELLNRYYKFKKYFDYFLKYGYKNTIKKYKLKCTNKYLRDNFKLYIIDIDKYECFAERRKYSKEEDEFILSHPIKESMIKFNKTYATIKARRARIKNGKISYTQHRFTKEQLQYIETHTFSQCKQYIKSSIPKLQLIYTQLHMRARLKKLLNINK